jgi:hypothetical protein
MPAPHARHTVDRSDAGGLSFGGGATRPGVMEAMARKIPVDPDDGADGAVEASCL